MPYVQTLIDDFNDASLDLAKWTVTQGPGASESGGTLNLACVADYPRVEGDQQFDLSKGIFAAKLTVAGTRVDACEFYLGAEDGSGNAIAALGAPNGSYLTFNPSGSVTFNTEVIVDTTVGLGSGWVNGTWWGIGNLGTDNILYMYKSTDGQNWTEMAHCTVGGTFTKTAVGMMFQAGIWNGTTTDLTAKFDDASYFALETTTFVTRKVMWNGVWIPAVPKARIGGAWVPASPKPRIGGAWDDQI